MALFRPSLAEPHGSGGLSFKRRVGLQCQPSAPSSLGAHSGELRRRLSPWITTNVNCACSCALLACSAAATGAQRH
eukprot:1151542-Pleurochrysis_carterae.AAC.1